MRSDFLGPSLAINRLVSEETIAWVEKHWVGGSPWSREKEV